MIEQYDCDGCGFWAADYEVTWPDDLVTHVCEECYWYDPEDEDREEKVRVLNSGMRTFVGGN